MILSSCLCVEKIIAAVVMVYLTVCIPDVSLINVPFVKLPCFCFLQEEINVSLHAWRMPKRIMTRPKGRGEMMGFLLLPESRGRQGSAWDANLQQQSLWFIVISAVVLHQMCPNLVLMCAVWSVWFLSNHAWIIQLWAYIMTARFISFFTEGSPWDFQCCKYPNHSTLGSETI